ncbi:DUF4097 family beta strand repeat-containing protein [Streptococcus oricebi]|uniref:DUF4097 domain-containing protein n=1 Tax=Streptococcus oricebi TaxID=1547447 RepID=A0ABS5B5T1_9STRE|nr:DUF4097 family beta strand repeat-containing protein [Streptococcus oricebi]MBP2624165.1 hypothetical protein [Streptococcus oricebi]
MTNSKKTWVKSALITCLVGVGLFAVGDLTGGVDQLRNAANKIDVQKKEETYDQINDLDVDLNNRDLIIEDSDDQKVHLTYYVQKKKENKVSTSQEDGKLTIRERGANQPRIITGFHLDLLNLFRDNAHAERAVTLRLPKGTSLKNLTVYSDNGPVRLATSDKLLTQKLDLSLGNGELTLDNLEAQEFTIDNDNGAIRVKNSQLLAGNLESDNGEVEFRQTKVANSKISQSNGALRTSQLELDGSTTFENDNGNMEFNLTAASYQDLGFNLRSDLGGISVPSGIQVTEDSLKQTALRQTGTSGKTLNASANNGHISLVHD